MTKEEYIRGKIVEFFKAEVTLCEINEETMEILPSDVVSRAEELVKNIATFSLKPNSIEEKGNDVLAVYQDITAIISKDMSTLKLQYNSDLCVELRNIAACPVRQLRNFIAIVNLAIAGWLDKWKEDTKTDKERFAAEKRLAEMQSYFEEQMKKPVKYRKYMQLRTLYYNIQAMKEAMDMGSYEWKYQYSVTGIHDACEERGISYNHVAWREEFYSMPKQYEYTPVDEETRKKRLRERMKNEHLLKIGVNRAIIDFGSIDLHKHLTLDVQSEAESTGKVLSDHLLIYLAINERACHTIHIPMKHYDALKGIVIEGIIRVNELIPELTAGLNSLEKDYYIYTAFSTRTYSTLYPFCLAKSNTLYIFGYDVIDDKNIPACKTIRKINTILNKLNRDMKNIIKKESRP